MTFAMTVDERESFLEAVRIGVLSITEPDRGPLSAPVWYGYEAGGELWFVTGRESRKGKLLEVGIRISLCVQTEDPPYKYVSVEGPLTHVGTADVEEHNRPLARRYLGTEGGDRYVADTLSGSQEDSSIVVRMRPERWLTVDYGKR